MFFELPLELFQKILLYTNDFNLVCEFGNYWVIDKMYNPKIHTFTQIVMYGHLRILKLLYLKGPVNAKDITDALGEAASLGKLEIVKWLYYIIKKDFPKVRCRSAIGNAAASNHLDVLEWLHYNTDFKSSKSVMDFAANNGHLEIVKWLHFNRTEGCSKHAMHYAAKNGHLEILEWLHENRSEGCTKYAMNLAAIYNRLEVVKWLYHNRIEGSVHHALLCAEEALQEQRFFARIFDGNWYDTNKKIIEFLKSIQV